MHSALRTAFSATLLLIATGAYAQAVPADFVRECEAKLPPTSIRLVLAPLAYTTASMPVAQLNQKHPTSGGTTLGLTEARQLTQANYGGSRLKRSDGWACMRPSVTLSVDVGPQRVWVGAEFPKGTCAYNHILTHELRHVQANQQHAVAVVKRYEAEMRQAFGNTIYYGRSDELTENLDRVVRVGWFPRLQAQLADADKLHALIDSPQEYAYNSVACSGEITRLLSGS